MNKSIDQMLEELALNWPEHAKSTPTAMLRLFHISEIFQNMVKELMARYDLQRADFGVLVTLRRSEKPYCLSPTILYQSMLFSSGGLTKVLHRLTQAELIERLDNANDKRSKLVQLTPKGIKLVEKIKPELNLQESKHLNVLNTEELEQLDTLLKRVLDQFE